MSEIGPSQHRPAELDQSIRIDFRSPEPAAGDAEHALVPHGRER
jgi:hypothetical protein